MVLSISIILEVIIPFILLVMVFLADLVATSVTVNKIALSIVLLLEINTFALIASLLNIDDKDFYKHRWSRVDSESKEGSDQ